MKCDDLVESGPPTLSIADDTGNKELAKRLENRLEPPTSWPKAIGFRVRNMSITRSLVLAAGV